ncbi:extensin family protein [Neorhizobium sp. NPDC001467]|uniref:extensin-like domain-containing protein n=1 Tax=Neorhizobium sp. NPDC001467 TaxID=3390595 RepID=UPI003CFDBADE
MAYALFWRRVTASLMISTMLTACSAEGLVPSVGVDNGTRVGAIRPMPPASMPANQTYGGTSTAGLSSPMPPASVDQGQSSYGYLRAPGETGNPGSSYAGYDGQNGGIARQPMPPATGSEQWGGPMPPQQSDPYAARDASRPARQREGRLPSIDSDEGVAAVASGMSARGSDAGVNMDDGLGVAGQAEVVGLAQEQQTDIAEGIGSQPVVDGIGTDSPRALARQGKAVAPDLGEAPVIVPPKRAGSGQRANLDAGQTDNEQPWQRQSTPFGTRQVGGAARAQEVAMLRTPNPLEERAPIAPPRGPEAMPASEAACRVELRRLGVEFRNVPTISDGPSCGIDYPVELTGLSGDIDVKPSVKLNCQTTLAFARWVKYELAPSSRYRYWSGVKRIVPMGGYSCRRMNNSRQKYNPMSEHARGNAIDVGKFVLKNGKDIDVRKKGLFSFREGALLKAVRTDSCKYFNTVLGPGSNKEHWNHFHFDLRQRKSNSRYCD